ncbi:MAG: penicillin-binding protein [Deltaproteobacteria bacterium]|nr:penicillin-binding protein [Deltaproteobacteria bacterium]
MRLARLARLARAATLVVTFVNAVFLALLLLAFAVPLPARDDGWSVVVEYRDGRPAYVFLSPDDKWRLQVELERVDPKLVEALVALEDKRFWSHDGVDPVAIGRAAWTNLTHARRVSGGSTISMQLARLLEPRPRTVPNKLVDMFRALQLDLRLSKREILEAYLARTPYGENVEGVESAAWAYFGHAAQHLTPLEIATLLAVPQGPARFAPSPANEARLRGRRDAILGKLVAAGVFAEVDARAAVAESATTPPPERLRPMPREAPHAAIMLHGRYRDQTRIRSTLDAGAQALVEREVGLRAPELHRKGIYGGAIVVVDHRTREVVALAGSLDFADTLHGGQIAMFDRPRSPGSTLKPLLYALAIDRGLALPGYLVSDVPSQYGTYRPRNFDGDWAGLVTLEDALSRSLNLPFIDLLGRLGVEHFIAELERMGVAATRAVPGQYGLSLIVGGIELTPLEIAGLYATLAEDGMYRPLRLVDRDPSMLASGADAPIFAAGAAFLTRQTLTRKDRPDFPRRRDVQGLPPEIHWKTGTSFGFRDAWAVGSGPVYTTVVWTGNVDNKPSTELVGSEAAGPMLFDVLEGLADRSRLPAPIVPPADLTQIEVCAYSGHVPSDACDHRVKVLAPLHAVPTAPCPYHQAYEVDRETSRAVLPTCRLADHAYDRKSFVVLPSSVNAWLAERHRAIPEPPVFAEACTAEALVATTLGAPMMVAPSEGQIVMLIPGVPANHQSVPLAVSTRAATVSWFVDGELVGTAPASERLYWVPTPGVHEVLVADAAGRKARRKLDVRIDAPVRP